jgi:hypothetical protein
LLPAFKAQTNNIPSFFIKVLLEISYLLSQSVVSVGQFGQLFLQSPRGVVRPKHLGSQTLHQLVQVFVQHGRLSKNKTTTSGGRKKQNKRKMKTNK